MDGRNKGDTDGLIDKPVTITDYDFLTETKNGVEKEYVCFVIKEDPVCFYFGGQVLTKDMREFEDDGYHAEIVENGLPVVFTTKKSKNKDPKTGMFFKYTAVEFYPDAEPAKDEKAADAEPAKDEKAADTKGKKK
jgi:hypothetical protein